MYVYSQKELKVCFLYFNIKLATFHEIKTRAKYHLLGTLFSEIIHKLWSMIVEIQINICLIIWYQWVSCHLQQAFVSAIKIPHCIIITKNITLNYVACPLQWMAISFAFNAKAADKFISKNIFYTASSYYIKSLPSFTIISISNVQTLLAD